MTVNTCDVVSHHNKFVEKSILFQFVCDSADNSPKYLSLNHPSDTFRKKSENFSVLTRSKCPFPSFLNFSPMQLILYLFVTFYGILVQGNQV